MKLLLLVGLFCCSTNLAARRRSIRKVREEIVEDVLTAINFYADNFHINDTIGRNIFEGALHAAAQAKSPAEREKSLIEFYETRGVVNISRVSSMNGFLMAAVPGLVEKYIFSNDLNVVLKKALALVFDEDFKQGIYREMERKLTCIVINCTEAKYRVELQNLVSTFTEVIQPIILENIYLFDQNNVHDSLFFDEVVDIATDKNRTLYQKSLDLGKLYEEKTSYEFKSKMARQMAKVFRNSYGQINRSVKSGQAEKIYEKLAKLAFDREFRDMDEEERRKHVAKIIFSTENEVKISKKKEETAAV